MKYGPVFTSSLLPRLGQRQAKCFETKICQSTSNRRTRRWDSWSTKLRSVPVKFSPARGRSRRLIADCGFGDVGWRTQSAIRNPKSEKQVVIYTTANLCAHAGAKRRH